MWNLCSSTLSYTHIHRISPYINIIMNIIIIIMIIHAYLSISTATLLARLTSYGQFELICLCTLFILLCKLLIASTELINCHEWHFIIIIMIILLCVYVLIIIDWWRYCHSHTHTYTSSTYYEMEEYSCILIIIIINSCMHN